MAIREVHPRVEPSRDGTIRHVNPVVCRGNRPADYDVVPKRDPETGAETWVLKPTGGGGGIAPRTYPRVVNVGASPDEHGVLRSVFAGAETVVNPGAFAPRSAKNSKGGRVQTDPNATRETMLSEAQRLDDAARIASQRGNFDLAESLRSEARTLRRAAPPARPDPPETRGYGASWPTTLITRDSYRHHGHDTCPTCGTVCGAVRRPGPNGGLGPCSVRGDDRGKGDPNAPKSPRKAVVLAEKAMAAEERALYEQQRRNAAVAMFARKVAP